MVIRKAFTPTAKVNIVCFVFVAVDVWFNRFEDFKETFLFFATIFFYGIGFVVLFAVFVANGDFVVRDVGDKLLDEYVGNSTVSFHVL